MGVSRHFIAAAAAVMAVCASGSSPFAETIDSALVKAYQGNPQLNAQRAQVRSIDENVPQALSGYRPKVAVTATLGEERGTITQESPPVPGGFLTTITTNSQ